MVLSNKKVILKVGNLSFIFMTKTWPDVFNVFNIFFNFPFLQITGKGASRKDLWSLVEGEEMVVIEFLKADLGCEDNHLKGVVQPVL